MAENSYATALSTGGRVARVLSDEIHENLYDPTGLRALMTMKGFGAAGSATTNVTKVARGAVAAAASTEVSGGFSQTVPTTTNYDITVARYGAIIAPTDLFKITGGAYDIPYVLGILMQALDLTLHLEKPLYMLSTGSKRKVWLAAALASGAALTLLDEPFAALDRSSIRSVLDLLREAASHRQRAWVVADYEAPPGVPLAQHIDLGD